jgi:hypothetical protein
VSLHTDLKFAGDIAHLVRNFKRKGDYLFNFSCPICGDSKKNRLRARGFIYRRPQYDGLSYKCHKCGRSEPFGSLLKSLDDILYKEYLKENFLERRSGIKDPATPSPQEKIKEFNRRRPTALNGLPTIAQLPDDHSAKAYLLKRKIPTEFLRTLYYTDDFPALIDKVTPGHSYALKRDSRIVIPFLDQQHNLLAIQGRSLDPNAHIRYITIKSSPDAPKIYGLDRLDKSLQRRIYVVEGPFDSMFLPNCIAVAGSDIPSSLPRDRVVVVYDNEPKKTETADKMEAAVKRGFRVCVWPKQYIHTGFDWKDINDMVVKGGLSPATIRTIIDTNSYTGLIASTRITKWRTD